MLNSSGIARRETAGGAVELYYEDLGDPAAPPVLLIMGLGAQLPMWPDGFCAQLVDAGYRVIRFDHRDTGLSAKMHGLRAEGSVYRRVGALSAGQAQSGALHLGRHDRRTWWHCWIIWASPGPTWSARRWAA